MSERNEFEVQRGGGMNWTTMALIAGLLLVVLLVAYFSIKGSSDQDKLTQANMSSEAAKSDPEKLCANKTTYDLIKRELFRRAAQLRGSDQQAFDKLAPYASLRMENPVMESEDQKSHAVSCSASATLDLPPGVEVVGGRRSLPADLDYVVQQAADGSGLVVMLRNPDPIVTPLATLVKAGQPAASDEKDATVPDELAPLDDGDEAAVPEPPVPAPTTVPKPMGARPSFSCASARSKGEIAVCNDAGLAALDRNMAAQFGRALSLASPEQEVLLRRTGNRFISYRDHCSTNSCIGDAYTGRMREIRDIMEGRWQPQ